MMSKNKRPAVSTYIRTLYSDGISYLRINYFNLNLSLCFAPCVGKDHKGRSDYDFSKKLATTITYEDAALLYYIARSIVDGKNSQITMKAVIPSYKNAAIRFDYKPDQNNQMWAYLAIDKDNRTIPFVFSTQTVEVEEDNRLITKVIQSGLGAFGMILQGYLTGINADGHLTKLSEYFDEFQDEDQKTYLPKDSYQGNNRYQGENNNHQNPNANYQWANLKYNSSTSNG